MELGFPDHSKIIPQPHTACTQLYIQYMGNAPHWSFLMTSLKSTVENRKPSWTRHRQPLTWPYTAYKTGLWTFPQDLCQIAITLTANRTKDPRGRAFERNVCKKMFVLSSNTFSSDTLKQNSLLYRLDVFTMAKISVICLCGSYNGLLEAIQPQLSFVQHRGIIFLPHSWDMTESQQRTQG